MEELNQEIGTQDPLSRLNDSEKIGRREFANQLAVNYVASLLVKNVDENRKLQVYEHYVHSIHVTMLKKGETTDSTMDELYSTAKSYAHRLVTNVMIKTDISGSEFSKPYTDTQDLTELLEQAGTISPEVVKDTSSNGLEQQMAQVALLDEVTLTAS